jgi:hypothetical protein
MFSEKEYADRARDFYMQQHKNFRVEEIRNSELTEFCGDIFYMAGVKGIYMDNGLAGCMIKREDLLKAPDWTGTPEISIPVLNPGFMLAHLKMSQETGWRVNYETREKKLDGLEKELAKESVNAKFLVPTKGLSKNDGAVSSYVLDQNTTFTIPCLTGKDGASAIPAFTDWKQFRQCYSDKEYAGWIIAFTDLTEMVMSGKGYDAIVINIGGCPMEVTVKSIERMRSVLRADDV